MTFAQRAKELMKRKGISQNELARRAGLSSSGISTTLSDTGNPRESSMISIYEALGMTPEEFWTEGRFSDALDPDQEHLLVIFEQLNPTGRAFMLQQAESILQQSAFRKERSALSAM